MNMRLPIVEQCNGKINSSGYCEKCHHVSQTTGGLCTQLYEIPLPESSSPSHNDIVQEMEKDLANSWNTAYREALSKYLPKLKQIGSESYWKKMYDALLDCKTKFEVWQMSWWTNSKTTKERHKEYQESLLKWQQLKSSIGEETEGQRRPKVVCLCGSTRFMDAFQSANLKLTMEGIIVSVSYTHLTLPTSD